MSLRHFLRSGAHVIQRAYVQERLLWKIIGFAVADRVEALERVGDLRVDAFLSGELLGDKERLAEEALDLSGARHDQLVFFAELIHAKNGDDVLQVAVALKHGLNFSRDAG